MTIEEINAELKVRIAAVGSERDKLRELIDSAQGLDESMSEAIDCLDRAADALSELV